MKDLTGYLKRILLKSKPSFFVNLLLTLFFSFSFLSITTATIANTDIGNFEIIADFEHTLTQEEINTEIILKVTSKTPRVLSYYTATIPLEDLRVNCANLRTRERLDCTTYNRGSSTDVMINLKNSVVRPDSRLEISLSYSIPMDEEVAYNLSSDVRDTTTNSVLIRYHKDMGEPLWTSDPIHNIRTVGENYEVLIEKPTHTNISLLFGEKVVYRFDINKVFSNTLNNENQTFELYVPSDTPTQTVIWEEITPLPNAALKDDDGNYIFKYILGPEETIDCNITGYIQKTKAVETEEVPRAFLTQDTGYWSISGTTEFRRINTFLRRRGLDVDNDFDDVEELDDIEKELFYRYVYQYVTERLNVRDDVTLGIGKHTRLGANSLVDSPNEASPIDYADFYITILRKYNVPSRLVVGYISNITGYTADGFYHHWVEYLDTKENTWVTADPFLEEHFEKSLFGSSFLDHIVIIRRGRSAVAPRMSFFQETDFIVRAETSPDIMPEFEIDSELSFEEYKSTEKYVKGHINILNTGNIAINGYDILKSNIKNISSYIDPVRNLSSQIILPKQETSIQLNVPYEKIESNNLFVNILYNNLNRYTVEKNLETDIENITPTYISILSKTISISIFGIFVFLLYFGVIKLKKVIRKKQNG